MANMAVVPHLDPLLQLIGALAGNPLDQALTLPLALTFAVDQALTPTLTLTQIGALFETPWIRWLWLRLGLGL